MRSRLRAALAGHHPPMATVVMGLLTLPPLLLLAATLLGLRRVR